MIAVSLRHECLGEVSDMQPVVARYTRDDKVYSVVVAGYGKELKGAAPDIVAAWALTDGLVKKITAEAALPGDRSVLDQIAQLAELHEAGVLSAAEFEAKKTAVAGKVAISLPGHSAVAC